MLIDVEVGRGRVTGRCDSEFSSVGDAFIENFTKRDEVGASVCVNVGGETVVDLWGGRVAAADDATAVERRHDLAGVFLHEGGNGAVRAHADRPRRTRPARTGRQVLAGVRNERQGTRHGRDDAESLRRSAGAARDGQTGRLLRLELHGRTARGGEAVLGARHAQRLSHDHVRLGGGRAGAARVGPFARHVLPRRGRRNRWDSISGSVCRMRITRALRR